MVRNECRNEEREILFFAYRMHLTSGLGQSLLQIELCSRGSDKKNQQQNQKTLHSSLYKIRDKMRQFQKKVSPHILFFRLITFEQLFLQTLKKILSMEYETFTKFKLLKFAHKHNILIGLFSKFLFFNYSKFQSITIMYICTFIYQVKSFVAAKKFLLFSE